jgi:hypothetical protein
MTKEVMNERIWKLAKKAGINLTPAQFSGVLEDEVDEFALEDFAKLLIQECINVIAESREVRQTAYYYRNRLAEHFGVKE